MPAPANRRVLVVVPAWNEEGSVADVVDEIRQHLPTAGLLVVDDGSTDRTAEVARRAGALVLELPFNLGVGGAMRAGFRFAVREGWDVVVQVDADGQHDPGAVPELLAALEHADIVIGARFAERGDYRVRGPRRWAMWLLAASLSRITRARLTDSTSGFRAATGPALELFARHYPAEYLGDTVESLVLAARSGLRIRQVAVEMRVRAAGRPSQSPVKAAVYLVRAVLALVLALTRPRIPAPRIVTVVSR